MIFANQPFSHEMSDGSKSESVNVCFENGDKTLSLALDNSCGRMEKLGRADIRLLVGSKDVTDSIFKADPAGSHVHASIENFETAMRWLNRAEWGMESGTACTPSGAEVE
jgi:hypothetical protein